MCPSDRWIKKNWQFQLTQAGHLLDQRDTFSPIFEPHRWAGQHVLGSGGQSDSENENQIEWIDGIGENHDWLEECRLKTVETIAP
jgi:hypothetical protein